MEVVRTIKESNSFLTRSPHLPDVLPCGAVVIIYGLIDEC